MLIPDLDTSQFLKKEIVLIGTQEYTSQEEKERIDKLVDEMKNKRFYIDIILLNGKHIKLILRKSDRKSDIYDILVFARRDIEEVKIPSFIEKIEPFAFADSEINKIYIPSNVKEIGEAFYKKILRYKQLKNVHLKNQVFLL